MNKPIIIDGVDVSECQYFQFEDDEYTCKAEEGCECAVVACRSYSDCYYKQLQRLKSENEKLKKAKEEYYLNNLSYEIKLSELTHALEEIRDIAIKKNYLSLDEALDDITNKINEVLK